MQGAIQNPKSQIEDGESGQALVLALLALALAVLLVSGFLFFASTSQRATQAAEQQTVDRYSADAGVEYGLWQLQYGGLTNTLTITSPPAVFPFDINGQMVVVTITQVFTP